MPHSDSDRLDQEALLRNGALQNAILNSANFSSIATDAAGVIQLFNVGAEVMLGYSAAEVMNKITPADISDPAEVIARARALSLELGTPITPGFEALVFKASRGIEDIYELTYIRKDGSRFPAVVSVTALRSEAGTIIGYLLIGTDNTARMHIADALRERNSELENARITADKANLAKSEFLSSMSHELRSPLNAILGFAQLLDTDSPPPTANQKVSIGQILRAGWYLLELINEILDLAVIEAGQQHLSVEPVSLAEVMRECQAIVQQSGRKKGITFTFPTFSQPRFVQADRLRLKQVMINLLSNAVKYNRPNGLVSVYYQESAPGRTRIHVKDTGWGLSPEKLTQLFQPFNRLGQEGSEEPGTGIGLVMSRLLVELMDGSMGVESTAGLGSDFWFELRTAPNPTPDGMVAGAERAAGVDEPSQAPIRTLLYVEDNTANLLLVEQIVSRRADIRLLTAGDGRLGVELAREHLPDVILMDINLPGISGIQAMKLLRDDPTTAHIPVMAISASAMLGDSKRGMEAGFFQYITKPINVREFMSALDRAFAAARSDSTDDQRGRASW